MDFFCSGVQYVLLSTYLCFISFLYLDLYLGPNKHGLVTYIQVNVYIGNTFSWLNGGCAFKSNIC